MRFAVPDSSDEDSLHLSADELDAYGSDSSEYDYIPEPSRSMRRAIGLQDMDDSDDELERMLGEKVKVKVKVEEKISVPERIAESKTRPRPKAKTKAAGKKTKIKKKATGELTMEDMLDEKPSEYEGWLKSTEEDAWREGQEKAHFRGGEMRALATNARMERKERERRGREETALEIGKLLEGLAIKQVREQDEIVNRFHERKNQLWSEIDSAIREAEKTAAEQRAAAVAQAKKAREEEEAKIAAAEKAAVARKAEAERLAREHMERERKEKEDREAELKRKEEQEETDRKNAEGNLPRTEWSEWVKQQQWMKTHVIDIVKADKGKAALKVGMRLMTRGLGQVVNTKESILKVTGDIDKILCDQLPSRPTVSNPTVLDQPPPAKYSYLLSHLAKALIKQAEAEVNAKPDAAFPLARIVVGLLLRGHAAFGKVLFARQTQSREDYEKSTGRGSDESLSDYISRMAGITTLYFAILQVRLSSLIPTIPVPPTPSQLVDLIPPVFRLPSAWKWLSYSLRDPLPSLPPIAHLVAVCMDILGPDLVRTYGRGQMAKIVEAIAKQGLEGEKIKGDSEASKMRLGLMVENWRKGGMGDRPPASEWKD
ncbi:nucleoporin GLE1, partial [Tremellales sp. Uapishka_1]